MNLVPSGDQRLCLGDSISFACSTTGDLLWETSSDSGNHVFDDAAQPSVMLGIFLLSVEHVSMTGGVNSTAMVSNVQASDNGTSLTCLEMSHTNVKSQAILKVGMFSAKGTAPTMYFMYTCLFVIIAKIIYGFQLKLPKQIAIYGSVVYDSIDKIIIAVHIWLTTY